MITEAGLYIRFNQYSTCHDGGGFPVELRGPIVALQESVSPQEAHTIANNDNFGL